jgi:RNA recognition motif-containing protein
MMEAKEKMAKLYVGNLSAEVTDKSLEQLFTGKGFPVTSARVICDREGGRSRGFGFVELASSDDVDRAIAEVNGFTLEGRALQVNEARPQQHLGKGVRSQGEVVSSGGRSGNSSRRTS